MDSLHVTGTESLTSLQKGLLSGIDKSIIEIRILTSYTQLSCELSVWKIPTDRLLVKEFYNATKYKLLKL